MKNKFFCKDRVLAIILLVISVYFAWQASLLPASILQKDPGPKIFPWIGCGILGVCGVILLIRPTGINNTKMDLNKAEKKRLAIMLGLYLLIIAGTLLVGIMYILPVVLFIVSYLFSKSSVPNMTTKKRLITTLIYTVCLCGALYLIYVVAMDVRLKPGILLK